MELSQRKSSIVRRIFCVLKMKKYQNLLKIPLHGAKIGLLTDSNTLVCNEYNRVVIGQRGPYIEFEKNHINDRILYVPTNQLYRLSDPRVFYIEFRTNDESNVKVYYQLRTVAYADYKIGYFYISPSDLFTLDGTKCLLDNVYDNEQSKLFFEFN